MRFSTGVKIIKNLLLIPFYKKLNVLSDEETIDYIIKNKCSVSRYGDGEFALIKGSSIGFQKSNEELKEKLINVSKYSADNFLVCIPDIFNKTRFNKKNIRKEEYLFWQKDKSLNEIKWKKYFGNQKILGDTFISRFYLRKTDSSNIDNYIKKIKLLWNQKNIVFIEGNRSLLGYGNDLFDNAKSIKRIICPAKNAFNKYNEIIENIKNKVAKNDLLILALGPTATVMALDLGHIDIEYEWYKMGAKKKMPILNKAVNECNSDGSEYGTSPMNEYYKEIMIDLSK